jgi:hypothetical protein
MRNLSISAGQAVVAALLWAAGSVAGAAELVVNGGFEQNGGAGTNVFTGWTVSDQAGSDGSFFAQTGTSSPPPNVITVPPPPQGSFSAMTSQGGPGSHIIYQNITIPPGASTRLTLALYINNQSGTFATPSTLDYTAAPNQQARVDVMTTASAITDVGSGVLLNVYQTKVGDPPVSGYTQVAADLTPFAGQTVRLRIVEVDDEGFFNVGVDQVSVDVAAPVPAMSDYTLIALGVLVLVAGFVTLRRRSPIA